MRNRIGTWLVVLVGLVLVSLGLALAAEPANKVLPSIAVANVAWPTEGYVLWLDDGNSHSFTLPESTGYVLVSPVDMTANTSAAVWCRADAAGALPADDVTNGTASVPITGPAVFTTKDRATIQCIRTGSNTIAVYIAPYKTELYRPAW